MEFFFKKLGLLGVPCLECLQVGVGGMHGWKPVAGRPATCKLVPTAGVEPARLAPLPPQDSVSTNSTTSAKASIFFDNPDKAKF